MPKDFGQGAATACRRKVLFYSWVKKEIEQKEGNMLRKVRICLPGRRSSCSEKLRARERARLEGRWLNLKVHGSDSMV